METRKGLFTKLGIFGGIAVVMVSYGRHRAASYRNSRHVNQTDAVIDSTIDEFDERKYHPGMQEESNKYERESKFVGAGNSYSSRKKGDRLTMFKIFDRD